MSDRKDSGGVGAAKKAMDTVGGMVGQAKAATMGSVSANSFVENAAIGDLYELAAGRMAEERGRSPEIRRFGREIVADHTTSTHQLRSSLRMAGTNAKPPEQVDSRRGKMIQHLQEASDEQFDEVWLDQQKLAHSETLTLFEGFESSGSDPQLRSYARSMVPGIRLHKKMVEQLS